MPQNYRRIDADGFFIEDVIYEPLPIFAADGETITGYVPAPADLITLPVPEGLFKPRWDGAQWVEGDPTAAADHQKNHQIQRMRYLLWEVRQALAERADPLQLASYANKADRARRVAAGSAPAADEAIIELEAAARQKGETALDLAAKQLQKEHDLATVLATLDGLQSRFVQLAQDAPDNAALSVTVLDFNTALGGVVAQLPVAVPAEITDQLNF